MLVVTKNGLNWLTAKLVGLAVFCIALMLWSTGADAKVTVTTALTTASSGGSEVTAFPLGATVLVTGKVECEPVDPDCFDAFDVLFGFTTATVYADNVAKSTQRLTLINPNSTNDAGYIAFGLTGVSVGSHSFRVVFNGDNNHQSSTSATGTFTVFPRLTATTVVSTSEFDVELPITAYKPVNAALGSGTYTYSISGPNALPAGLVLDPDTGIISGTPTNPTTGAVSLTMKVTDGDAFGSLNQATANFSISVSNRLTLTIQHPTIELTQNWPSPGTIPGVAHGGRRPYFYGGSPFYPSGLSIDSATGALIGTTSATTTGLLAGFNVQDQNFDTVFKSFVLIVNRAVDATTTIGTRSLTVGRPANSQGTYIPVAAGFGTGALTYSVTPPLPTGLSLNANTGEIIGTPTVTAAGTYTIRATDRLGASDASSFQLIVNPAVVATSLIGFRELTRGTTSPDFKPAVGSQGTQPLVYSITPALPSGLSIGSNDGVITGTAQVDLASTLFTIRVTDLNGSTGLAFFSLKVNPPPVLTTLISTRELTQNRDISISNRTSTNTPYFPTSITGGTYPITYSISPAAPAGLTLNTSTGRFTGIPTTVQGPVTSTITVTDANGATSSTTTTFSVVAPPSGNVAFPSRVLTAGTTFSPFAPVVGFNGSSPLQYTVSPSLPTGLSVGLATGIIVGPATDGVALTTYTMTLQDENGASTTGNFNLTVNAILSATSAIPATTLSPNVAASFIPVTGANGRPPYVFALDKTLPTGLTFSTLTGTVSGRVATTVAPDTYRVTITDLNGATASADFSLAVSNGIIASQVIRSKVTTVGSENLSIIPVVGGGGVAPLVYSISPALPTGLSMNSTTGRITGIPGVILPAKNFVITVTDANGAFDQKDFGLTVNNTPQPARLLASKVWTQNYYLGPGGFRPVAGSQGTAPLSYGVTPALPAGLVMDQATGAIEGTPTSVETNTTHSVAIVDATGASTSGTFTLTINPAVATTRAVASRSLTLNIAAVPFTPVTAANGTGSLTYSIKPILPVGLTMNPLTGLISGTPTQFQTATPVVYTVTATDSIGATSATTFEMTVNRAVVAEVNQVGAKAITLGRLVSPFTPVSGTGGTGSLAYSILPALPAGLSMNPSTGQITGTPTAVETNVTHTVTIRETNGGTSSASFVLTVNPAVTAQLLITSKAMAATAVVPSFIPVVGSGGTGTLSYSVAPALPTGITMSSSTGEISGKPTTLQGPTNYTITVSDTQGSSASRVVSLSVTNAMSLTNLVAFKALTVNIPTPGFQPASGSGGSGALTYSISPALPAGLVLNSSTGMISGTASAIQAASTYVISLVDGNGARVSANFTLAVNGPVATNVVIALKTLTQGAESAGFVPVLGTGGVAPYQYQAISPLPAGLVISPTTGTISGAAQTPRVASDIEIRVIDSNGGQATGRFQLAVNQAVTATVQIASKSLTVNAVSSGFTPVIGANGTGSLVYSVSGPLPAGLTLNGSTGEITGTPSVAIAAQTFAITVRDTNGSSATAGFSLAVNRALTANVLVARLELGINLAVSNLVPIVATNGLAPYTYSVAPTLPTGLVLEAATGKISGTPTALLPASNFVMTVTDLNGATASAGFALLVSNPTTSTNLSSSANPASLAQPVTFIAAVTSPAGKPAGTVRFMEGAQLLGSASLRPVSLTSIAAGDDHNCAVLSTGAVSCWGLNSTAQLGDGSVFNRSIPTSHPGYLSGVSRLVAGGGHTCALTTAGAVQCWGENARGQLGDGSLVQRAVKTPVKGLSSGIVDIDAGGNHSCAITATGGVKCWGDNSVGQLGDGTRTDKLTPSDVGGLPNGIVDIALGENHSCALSSTGAVFCWGSNASGQLGDNSTVTRNSPVSVAGLDRGVTAIAAGGSHSCALKSTGVLFCWGYNGDGEVGDGTTTNRQVPTPVATLPNNVTAVSIGNYHSCALMGDGSVRCWGDNSAGQIGDDTTFRRLTPTAVTGLASGISGLAIGGFHSCALRLDGDAVCWGKNINGQLGDGTGIMRRLPVQVSGLSGQSIASLRLTSLAIGSHPVTAEYQGNGTYSGSVSVPLVQVINRSTTTRLTSTVNPSRIGEATTLQVTVTSDAGTPSGDVTLYDGEDVIATLSLSGGTTRLAIATLSGGTHILKAVYGGAPGYSPSTSSPVTQVVEAKPTTISLTSSNNPSIAGSSIVLRVAVTGIGGTPTGQVSLFDGGILLANQSLAGGEASFAPVLNAGNHPLKVVYSGDSTFAPSTSAIVNQAVVVLGTSTSISSSVNPVVTGQPVVFTARVSAATGTPSGTVTFLDGTLIVDTASLSNGVARSAAVTLTAGDHRITARYDGVTGYKASQSGVLVQKVVKAPTATAVVPALRRLLPYQPLTIEAKVNVPTSPSAGVYGSVTFRDGARELGSRNLIDGKASLVVSDLGSGIHKLTAVYSGSSSTAASVSAVSSVEVDGRLARDIVVNQFTAGDQKDLDLAKGIVVWSSDGQDGSAMGVYGRKLTIGGDLSGPAFRANSVVTGSQSAPATARLSTGGRITVWKSTQKPVNRGDIYGRRMSSGGSLIGSEFRINSSVADEQAEPDVAALENGGFITVWSSRSPLSGALSIYGRRFDGLGKPIGINVRIDAAGTGSAQHPVVAGLPGGRYIVVWIEGKTVRTPVKVMARGYNADGSPATAPFVVSTNVTSPKSDPAVSSLSDGGFAVVWTSNGQDGSGAGVYGQMFRSVSGNTRGAEFRIPVARNGDQSDPAIGAFPSGGFVVSWTAADASGTGIFARRFDENGAAIDSEAPVNKTTTGNQSASEVAVNSDLNYMIGWTSASADGSGSGIVLQRFKFAAKAGFPAP